MEKGLLIVYTGKGKGKTTAALGLAFRAIGHGFRVCVIQFIKGSWQSGEVISAKLIENQGLDFHVMGRGFTWESDNIENDKAKAREAWAFAKTAISSGAYQMVILDELTYLMKYHFADKNDIIGFLSEKRNLHIVVTGRDAPQQLIDIADLVTEMCEIKHPFKSGVERQKGIEF